MVQAEPNSPLAEERVLLRSHRQVGQRLVTADIQRPDDQRLARGQCLRDRRVELGLLVLRANELVASDRLVEELWGAAPPPTAHKMLHNQVSALRQALGRNGRQAA